MEKNSASVMSKQLLFGGLWVLLFSVSAVGANAQVLTLKQAVQTALANYGTIRAKANYVKASQANVKETKREYLPDINFAAQQDYGTANSSHGPLAAYKVPRVFSAGPNRANHAWHTA